ncbi:hypothetical protein [Tsuneonella sp. HG222]
MPIGAIIGGVATLGSALIGSSGADKAANAQVASSQAGIAEISRQYDTTRGDLAPWRTGGAAAFGTLTARLSDLASAPDPSKFRTDPGYQFAFNEGQRAIESGGAARGTLMSGGTLKDLARFGTGLADQTYGNWYGRELAAKDSAYNKLAGVAGMGQNAAAQTGNFGQQSANSIADLLTQQGNARASGYAGQSQAWGGALNNLATLSERYL